MYIEIIDLEIASCGVIFKILNLLQYLIIYLY